MNAYTEPKYEVGQTVRYEVKGFGVTRTGKVWQVLSTRGGYEYVINIGRKTGPTIEERLLKAVK
jgi:hypothetical protein